MGTVTARLAGWSECAPAFSLAPLSISAAVDSAALFRRSASLSPAAASNEACLRVDEVPGAIELHADVESGKLVTLTPRSRQRDDRFGP